MKIYKNGKQYDDAKEYKDGIQYDDAREYKDGRQYDSREYKEGIQYDSRERIHAILEQYGINAEEYLWAKWNGCWRIFMD